MCRCRNVTKVTFAISDENMILVFRLPKIVGNNSWVREICYTGRFFGSDEAVSQGLVSQVYESKDVMIENAIKLGNLIASKSPLAVTGTKHILNYSRDRSVEEGLKYVALWNSIMIQSGDVGAAIMASMSKSSPVFSKL